MSITSEVTLPAILPTTIYRGSPWPGVRVLYVDPEGIAETITVTAEVATDTDSEGGAWLASCDVSDADADGAVYVTLDAVATAALPARQVLIDVMVLRDGETEPSLVMRLLVQVVAGLPAEPEP